MTDAEIKKLSGISKNYQANHLDSRYRQMSAEQSEAVRQMLDRFISAIPPELSNHEKALLLYQVITKCVRYNYNELDRDLRYSYLGAILTGTAVCNGVSQLYAILCLACNIPCWPVTGQIKGSKDYHAWNQIWLPDDDGNLIAYACDVTWDLGTGHPGNYRYYLKSDEHMISNNHQWLSRDYAPCPVSCKKLPTLSPELVERMCREFKKMYSPNRHPFTQRLG